MGIKGSSTTAVYFDNVRVPVENVLGEIGRGHIIAFNILNIGRLKLGPFALGGAKNVLAVSLKYAKERKAFGSPIASFGAIQHKLAEMAIRIFATESMVWRTVGLIAPEESLKTIEEYAVECSIVKVYASEMLDYVVDEGVQIHGGYGYHQDYAVERAYCDSRINRIFEGTNEINRLLITGMLLKRAARGQLALVAAAQKVVGQALSPPRRKAKPPWSLTRKNIALLDDGHRISEIRARTGEAAGSPHVDRRYRDGSVRHGIGACCASRKTAPAANYARCSCATRCRASNSPHAMCLLRVRKAIRCARI